LEPDAMSVQTESG